MLLVSYKLKSKDEIKGVSDTHSVLRVFTTQNFCLHPIYYSISFSFLISSCFYYSFHSFIHISIPSYFSPITFQLILIFLLSNVIFMLSVFIVENEIFIVLCFVYFPTVIYYVCFYY